MKCKHTPHPVGYVAFSEWRVKHVTIELDRDGGRCVMLITNPTITAYLIAQDGAVGLMAGRGQ